MEDDAWQVDDGGQEIVKERMQAKLSIPYYVKEENEDNIKLADFFFTRSMTMVEHQRDFLALISHQGDIIHHV